LAKVLSNNIILKSLNHAGLPKGQHWICIDYYLKMKHYELVKVGQIMF